ncbi:MAG: hypothetical protein V3V10_05200 [Planctomycetota bacterium]
MATLNPAVTEGNYTATLATLRVRVLKRLGFGAQTANPPPGMALLVDEFISSAQTQLATRFPELVTERFYTWTMVVDQRFYTTSGDDDGVTTPDFILDPKKITWVGVEDLNGTFYPLREGINPLLYTTETTNTGLPYAYEIRQSLEVFPAPDAAYLLQVKGRPKNFPLAGDADIVTIDDELIFLLALANAKAHYQQTDAESYFTQATSYLGTLNAGTYGTARFVPGTVQAAPLPQPVLLPLP